MLGTSKYNTMLDTVEIQSYQMQNILFYIVFCRHCEFVTILIKEMLNNIKGYYSTYSGLQHSIGKMNKLLDEGTIDHKSLVVMFFFLLTIDSKMRHWLVCTQQSDADKTIRDNLIKINIDMVPNGKKSTCANFTNPFLGQSVSFSPLHPKQAVGILLPLSRETFFQKMFIFGDVDPIQDLYIQIKRLVVCA